MDDLPLTLESPRREMCIRDRYERIKEKHKGNREETEKGKDLPGKNPFLQKDRRKEILQRMGQGKILSLIHI